MSEKKVREVALSYDAKRERTSNSDAKGRVALGSKFANKLFRITEEPDGNILLEPVVTIHERELWLWKNKEAMAAVQEGLAQSARGETTYLGSFSQYADEDDE